MSLPHPAGTLRDEIYEIHLKLNPVIVGAGTPLIDGGLQLDRYSLISSQPFDRGVVVLKYARRHGV